MADTGENWFSRVRRQIQEEEANQPSPPSDSSTSFGDRFGAATGAPAASWFERARNPPPVISPEPPGSLPALPPSSLPSWMPPWLRPDPAVQNRLDVLTARERGQEPMTGREAALYRAASSIGNAPYNFLYGAGQGLADVPAFAGQVLGVPGAREVRHWAEAPADSYSQSVGRIAAPGTAALKGAKLAARGTNYLYHNYPGLAFLGGMTLAPYLPHWAYGLYHAFRE